MTRYRDPIDPLSGETAVLQCDDVQEAETDYEAMETTEEQRAHDRKEYRRQVDRMIQRAAEAHIILRPGLRESEAYDFFISYASEDRESFVNELAQQLRQRGAKVWYDGFILRQGDSLRRQIDEGLANSLFGVVVLSPHFFVKEWPQRELDSLISLEIQYGEKRILPIWHRISPREVRRHSPLMLDRVALDTEEYDIEEIVEKLLQAKELRLANRKGGAYL